jgi:hypothetical protein
MVENPQAAAVNVVNFRELQDDILRQMRQPLNFSLKKLCLFAGDEAPAASHDDHFSHSLAFQCQLHRSSKP